MSQQRKLAAIMFTDIVGYTAMMQEDENQAVILRNRHREVFEKYHKAFKGNILQYYGDGTLSIFDSAIDASKCALAIQEDLQQEPKVPLRIGLHTGDIIYSEEEAIGDGVNIASRIESLAVPGSIMISETVRNYIKNQSEFDCQSMGLFSFKNVAKPLEVFALNSENIILPSPTELSGKFTHHKPPQKENFFQRMPIWAKYIAGFALFLVLAPFIYFPLYQTFTGSAAVQDNSIINHNQVKKFYVAPFVQQGGDSTHNWLGLGIPYALEMDWDQDPYIFNIYPSEAKDKALNTQLEEAITSHSPRLLKGTYRVTDEGYEIQVLIYEAKSGQLQHDSTYVGKELFPLLDEISVGTKHFLEIPEDHINQVKDLPLTQILTKSLPAYKLFASALSDRSTGANYFPFQKLSNAMKEDSTFAWAAYTISQFHHRFQRSKTAAEDHIDKAMRYRDRLPDIFEAEVRQLHYEINGEPEKALELSKMMAELNPAKHTFLIGLISDYFLNEQCDKAMESIKLLRTRQGPGADPFAFIYLETQCMLKNKEYKKAKNLAQDYIDENPENTNAKRLLGLVYLASEDWPKAKTTFEQLALLNPEVKNYERFLEHIQFMTDSTFDKGIFDKLVGEYCIESYANFKFNLYQTDGDLYVKIVNQQKGKLYPRSTLSYFTDYSFSLEFIQDSLGNVSKFKAAEGTGGLYDVIKIPEALSQGIKAFEEGKLEEAAPLLEKSIQSNPDYSFVDNMLKHIAFKKDEQYAKQVAGYSDLEGKYVTGNTELELKVKNESLYMISNTGNSISDHVPLYEIAPDTCLSLVSLNRTFVFNRKRGKVIGFDIYAREKKRVSVEKVD